MKNSEKQWKTGFGAKTSRYSSKFKFFNSKFELRASFCITNLKYRIYEASVKYGRRRGFHRREKQWKIVKNSDFGAKTSRYSSKFKCLNSRFEFQASFCITNLKYHTYEASAKYGRRGGFHRRENSQKTVEKQVLAPKLVVTAQNSNFWIQFLNFELLFALLTSNITYMKRLRSMDAEEASTDEKTVKTSEKTVVLAPKRAVTAQNSKFWIQNLTFKPLFLHY